VQRTYPQNQRREGDKRGKKKLLTVSAKRAEHGLSQNKREKEISWTDTAESEKGSWRVRCSVDGRKNEKRGEPMANPPRKGLREVFSRRGKRG